MNIKSTRFEGLFVVELNKFDDIRGSFVKIFSDEILSANSLNLNIKEAYFSTSRKNTIRGMHFQVPPYEHTKVVSVVSGAILDVVVDIRKNSKNYGECHFTTISADSPTAIIIPTGMAHGFRALEENSTVLYMQTSCYAPNYDSGIRYDSFGFDWGVQPASCIISQRDLAFQKLEDFDSPF